MLGEGILKGLAETARNFAGSFVSKERMTTVQYPLYASAPRAYGLSALADQQLAGAGMCFIEFLVFGIAFAAVFISMLGRDDARVAVAERAAAR